MAILSEFLWFHCRRPVLPASAPSAMPCGIVAKNPPITKPVEWAVATFVAGSRRCLAVR